jgi:hypothetical protein
VTHQMETATACVINIGPRERRKRFAFGLALLGVSVVLGAVLVVSGVPRPWRLTLFLPLWGAALGFFQAREKT